MHIIIANQCGNKAFVHTMWKHKQTRNKTDKNLCTTKIKSRCRTQENKKQKKCNTNFVITRPKKQQWQHRKNAQRKRNMHSKRLCIAETTNARKSRAFSHAMLTQTWPTDPTTQKKFRPFLKKHFKVSKKPKILIDSWFCFKNFCGSNGDCTLYIGCNSKH